QHFINGLSVGAVYALIALGYTMVYGVLQLINFAHSEVFMVGAFGSYYVARWAGLDGHPGILSFLVCLISAMVVCSAVGLSIERFAYRPLRNSPKLNLLITAIGVSLFLQFSGQVIFGADPKSPPSVLEEPPPYEFGMVQVQLFDVVILLVAI